MELGAPFGAQGGIAGHVRSEDLVAGGREELTVPLAARRRLGRVVGARARAEAVDLGLDLVRVRIRVRVRVRVRVS